MIEFIVKGGIFMYPIILCSILSLAIFLEKLWSLRRNKNIPATFLKDISQLLKDSNIDQALQLCQANNSPLSHIFQSGIREYGKKREIIKEMMEEVGRREASFLERYLEVLSTIANVSTLLGLLGTISGMIKIFSVISSENVVNPSNLAGGISEALYTTAAGLTVAIPTIVFHRYISGKSNTLIIEMEEQSLHLLDLIKEKE